MSSVIGRAPVLAIEPETRTAVAEVAAAFAAAMIAAGDFAASPFGRPAAPATSSRGGDTWPAPASSMCPSLSHTIAGMEARGIHHVGVAVADLDEAVRTYEQPLRRPRRASRARRGAGRRGGVRPRRREPGRAARRARRRTRRSASSSRSAGPGMHHVAYEVDDIRAALRDLAAAGAELIDAAAASRACSASRSRSCIPIRFTAFSRRWSRVAEGERVRVEIGFKGGQTVGSFVDAGVRRPARACAPRGRPAGRRPRHGGRPVPRRRPRRLVLPAVQPRGPGRLHLG